MQLLSFVCAILIGSAVLPALAAPSFGDDVRKLFGTAPPAQAHPPTMLPPPPAPPAPQALAAGQKITKKAVSAHYRLTSTENRFLAQWWPRFGEDKAWVADGRITAAGAKMLHDWYLFHESIFAHTVPIISGDLRP